MSSRKTPGEEAYETHRAAKLDGARRDGSPVPVIPEWAGLSFDSRAQWEASASAAIAAINKLANHKPERLILFPRLSAVWKLLKAVVRCRVGVVEMLMAAEWLEERRRRNSLVNVRAEVKLSRAIEAATYEAHRGWPWSRAKSQRMIAAAKAAYAIDRERERLGEEPGFGTHVISRESEARREARLGRKVTYR